MDLDDVGNALECQWTYHQQIGGNPLARDPGSWEVNVPLQDCGYDEIIKFSMAPLLYNYQLLLVDETRGYCIEAFGLPQEKQLLLYNGHHYDAFTSLPGYFATIFRIIINRIIFRSFLIFLWHVQHES